MSRYSGIQINVLSSLCLLKQLKSGIPYPHNTCTHSYGYTSSSIMVRYVAYRKFSVQVEALPKIMLYEIYSTQKSDLEMKYSHIAQRLQL